MAVLPFSLTGLLAEELWAITPERLRAMAQMAADDWQGAPMAAASRPQPRTDNFTAVIPVRGVITQHEQADGLMALLFGAGTSIDGLTVAFRNAINDPSVSRIVFDIDSPGGTAWGVTEFAAEIMAARGQKPVIAVANANAGSAAYWIASAADELVVTPSGGVGSIGVYSLHQDLSGAYEQAGVVPTYISAGEYKTEGNDAAPLSDDAREYRQSQVNEVYRQFVADVAKGRRVGVSTVRESFGKGRMVQARAAVQAGMADTIGTLTSVLQRKGGPAVLVGMAATADLPEMVAEADVVEAEASEPTPIKEEPRVTPEQFARLWEIACTSRIQSAHAADRSASVSQEG